MALANIIETMFEKRKDLVVQYNDDRSRPAFLITEELRKHENEINNILENIKTLQGQLWRECLSNLKDERERQKTERALNTILNSHSSIKQGVAKLKSELGYYTPFAGKDAMERKREEILQIISNITKLCDEIEGKANAVKRDFPNQNGPLNAIITGTKNLSRIFIKRGLFH